MLLLGLGVTVQTRDRLQETEGALAFTLRRFVSAVQTTAASWITG